MKAQEVLRLARENGIHLAVVGSNIELEANQEPAQHILEALKANKPQIVKLLNPPATAWEAEDWQAFFDERAAIAEYCGGLSREQAEMRAFECCIVEWQNRHPEPSSPGRCAWCDKPDQTGDAVIPFGTIDYCHTWLHQRCWARWHNERRIKARSALVALGLRFGTTEFPNDFGKTGGK